MKLKDGRYILGYEVDENNHLVYIVKDDLAPNGEAAVSAQSVKVDKSFEDRTHINNTVIVDKQ